ncbi:macrolide family glycosyltransferase [Steroidobacter agaridevorans]|uniref:macrolide family glycosyltransferase n=1 Tax=Steroidobacter agaridevorans TaxID=2695856 RepID=UPI00132C91C8|nr:macrolide family glycosyltransferase [Steroidobacter agaridevorans]GFE91874.1 putative UDP-glucosyltransferase YjiC [Steroidobacter agaridevorans]
MKSRHIAVFTLLTNAHLYPVLGVCSELVNRGHRVTFATNDRYAPVVKQTGAEVVIFKDVKVENAAAFSTASAFYDQNFYTIWASIVGPFLILFAASAFPQLENYYKENKPDLILYDRACFVGRMLAARLGCSAVQLSPHFAPYGDTFIRENGVFLNPSPIPSFSQVLDCFLQAYGVQSKNNLTHAADLNIFFIPREFQFHGDSFDDRFCFVGPCLNRPAASEWRNNSGGKPIILVSGSQADEGTTYFRTMINAFSGSDFHVVLSPGANVSDDLFGPLPSNFELNRVAYNFQIIPHSTLTISQGGTGTVMETLYYGVPLLAVPRMPVHAETAYRLAELGLGGYLPEQMMSADSIREQVTQLLGDTSLASRIARMQHIVRDSGGAKIAANRIEQCLGSRPS